MEKILDIILYNQIIHGIILAILILDILRRRWIIKIKDKIIDNLCKDNANLQIGRADLVWKRMQGDINEEFKAARWTRFIDENPKHRQEIIICDKDFNNKRITTFEYKALKDQLDMFYWAKVPKKRDKWFKQLEDAQKERDK